MTTIAPMSSTIASASRNNLSDGATRLPRRLSTPTAIAMSVATGMPQPSPPDAARVEAQVDHRRHHHAAEGRDGWRRRLPAVAQLALHQLALDLQADDEEEQRHQAVVDPLLDGRGRVVARSPTGRSTSQPKASWPRRARATVAPTRTTPPAASVWRKSRSGRSTAWRGDRERIRHRLCHHEPELPIPVLSVA